VPQFCTTFEGVKHPRDGSIFSAPSSVGVAENTANTSIFWGCFLAHAAAMRKMAKW
jgi:hypothetical protein